MTERVELPIGVLAEDLDEAVLEAELIRRGDELLARMERERSIQVKQCAELPIEFPL